MQHHAIADHSDICTGPGNGRTSNRHDTITLGNLTLNQAIRAFVFKEKHGIGVANRRQQESLRISRSTRSNYLEAWRMCVECLDALRMIGTTSKPSTIGGTYNQWTC